MRLARDAFARAAATYDAVAALARETGARLDDRLSYTKIAPARMADIGCATGDGIRLLCARYPDALPLAVDFAAPMLAQVRARRSVGQRLLRRGPRAVQADVQALPFQPASLGLVWSNLMLHWLDDPLPALREVHRVMEVGGLLTFAVLGPDTAREWNAAAEKVGAGKTARRFLDMHDWGDLLVAAGFGDPVMDREDILLTYRSARHMLAEQRQLGVRDALFGNPGWRAARALLGAWPRLDGGRLPLTCEVVFGQAWKAPARAAREPTGSAQVVQFHRKRPI